MNKILVLTNDHLTTKHQQTIELDFVAADSQTVEGEGKTTDEQYRGRDDAG